MGGKSRTPNAGEWHFASDRLCTLADRVVALYSNARHEHEVWESVKLPQGKIIIPGVVIAHSTDVVEHPCLVAQRIFGGGSHPQIAWAKLKSPGEGAVIASKALFGRR